MNDTREQAIDILRGSAESTIKHIESGNFDPLILARAAKQSAALAEKVALEDRARNNATLRETAGVA